MMHADGSGRHRVGDFGAPFWSPDGREFLINSYSLPTTSTVINLETKDGGVVEVPGHQIFSWPSWVGPGTVVSALAPKEKYEGDSIALLDVRKPAEAKILEVLWKRDADLDVTPRWPVFRPETSQLFLRRRGAEKKGGPPESGALFGPSGVNPCERNTWGSSDTARSRTRNWSREPVLLARWPLSPHRRQRTPSQVAGGHRR